MITAGLMIDNPNDDDIHRIGRQCMRAFTLVRDHCSEELGTELDDLDRLQRLLDAGVLQAEQTYDLQCLGIAFGRILVANTPGLDWAMLDDEYGRDPTLRFEESSLTINTLTVLSKRIECGERVDVRELYNRITADLPAIVAEAD